MKPSTGATASFEVAVDPNGSLAWLETVATSGDDELAEEARTLLTCRAPFPAPSPGMLSWDGRAHFRAMFDTRGAASGLWRFDALWLTARDTQFVRSEQPRTAVAQSASAPHDLVGLRPGRKARWNEFREAIEHYRVGVRAGNTASLGAAADAWAAYLARFHEPLHASFAKAFLPSLPTTGDLADPALRTFVEIVVNPDGLLNRVGVVKSSGNSMYDFGAFNAVLAAGPYPAPPESIRSPDGLTYLRWALHRGESQCGTWNAEPFILKAESAPTNTDP